MILSLEFFENLLIIGKCWDISLKPGLEMQDIGQSIFQRSELY